MPLWSNTRVWNMTPGRHVESFSLLSHLTGRACACSVRVRVLLTGLARWASGNGWAICVAHVRLAQVRPSEVGL